MKIWQTLSNFTTTIWDTPANLNIWCDVTGRNGAGRCKRLPHFWYFLNTFDSLCYRSFSNKNWKTDQQDVEKMVGKYLVPGACSAPFLPVSSDQIVNRQMLLWRLLSNTTKFVTFFLIRVVVNPMHHRPEAASHRRGESSQSLAGIGGLLGETQSAIRSTAKVVVSLSNLYGWQVFADFASLT